MSAVKVKVPATTANLGPGFDCLGIALRLYNTVTVTREQHGAPDAMADAAADAFFRESGSTPFTFSWKVRGSVPRSRGLGSSVTVRLGILHGLNELSGRPLDPVQVYKLCSELEGHPDNAAPAAFGGFTIARRDLGFQRYRVDSRLHFVLLIPDYEVSTPDARRVLPGSVPFADAILAASNAAAIAGAFASRDYAQLPGCFEDTLHQPYRASLVPSLDAVIHAARQAGALGGWLSGSGSTMAAITLRDADRVAAAMLSASGHPGAHTVITRADNSGVRISDIG